MLACKNGIVLSKPIIRLRIIENLREVCSNQAIVLLRFYKSGSPSGLSGPNKTNSPLNPNLAINHAKKTSPQNFEGMKNYLVPFVKLWYSLWSPKFSSPMNAAIVCGIWMFSIFTPSKISAPLPYAKIRTSASE